MIWLSRAFRDYLAVLQKGPARRSHCEKLKSGLIAIVVWAFVVAKRWNIL